MLLCVACFFFFKQKTAYEMRISDWSSDVCSSDLAKARSALCWALGWCAAYLTLSLGAKSAVETPVRQALDHQGIAVNAMFSTPEPFNILLWRVVAKVDNDSYIENVRSVFDQGPSESLRRQLNTVLADADRKRTRLNPSHQLDARIPAVP